MAVSDHAILSNLGGFELNNLISILDIEDNEPHIIQHSSYYDIDSFKKLISNHNNIMCGALGKPCTLPKKKCCFMVDSECSTISQNKTVYIIKIFQPELDLQNC